MTIHLIESIPTWGLSLISIIFALVYYEIGFALGEHHKKSDRESQRPMGLVVGATIGLLAFMLAFTFTLANSLFEERKNLILEESNAIQRAYLRAAYLPQPYRTTIQTLLQDYVSTMVEGGSTMKFGLLDKKYEKMQEKIWVQAIEIGRKEPNSVMAGLFIQSLNDLIDIHFRRVLKEGKTVLPEVFWFTIYFLSILSSLAIGYQSGIIGNRGYFVYLLLVLTFASLILLTANLDRPHDGLVKESQQSFLDLQERMSSILREGGAS